MNWLSDLMWDPALWFVASGACALAFIGGARLWIGQK